jgi:hypothetical protein
MDEENPIQQQEVVVVAAKEEEENNNQLKCCSGGSSDKRLLLFVSILTISLIVIMFSIYQLTTLESCHDQHLYSGLLSLVLGIWIRSPLF